MQNTLDFLGYNISSEGVKPTTKKFSAISKFPQPTDSKSLCSFLGLVGFYRKLVPNFAEIVLPLTEQIKNNPNSKSLKFNEQEEFAFNTVKQTLAELSSLPHPVAEATHYQLVTDSSSYAVGAALHQIVEDEPIPIGFFSQKLSEAQRKYSTFDRELLATYLAVRSQTSCIIFLQIFLLKSDKQQRLLLAAKTS